MSRHARVQDAVAVKIDRTDHRRAEAKARKLLLDESARACCVSFAGACDPKQQRERLEYLLANGRDLLIEIIGPDDAHPPLAALSKDTGYRLTTARETAKSVAEKAFAKTKGSATS